VHRREVTAVARLLGEDFMSDIALMVRVVRQPVMVGLVALMTLAPPVHAAALTGTTTASLFSDNTTVLAADTVTIGPGIEISAGDGSNIGAQMLTGTALPSNTPVSEAIDFQSLTIALRILSGGTDGLGQPVTGWGPGAHYVFAGLNLDVGSIVSISATGSAADIANLGSLSSWVNLDNPNQISFALDNIIFVDKPGADYADIAINLVASTVTPPPGGNVPEPGSLALAGLAMAGLWSLRRRAARG
jgi:hypothetical protein